MSDTDTRPPEKPLGEWSDAELAAWPSYPSMIEQQRRAAERARAARSAPEDQAAAARRIARAHVVSSTGRSPEGAFERAARAPAPEPAVVTSVGLFEASAARVQAAQQRLVERAQDAAAEPLRVTRTGSAAPAGDPWARLTGRARAAISTPANGDPNPSPYVDPDDDLDELRRRGAQVVAKVRPGIGQSGRHPDLVRAERLG